jgi:hypothetical protein
VDARVLIEPEVRTSPRVGIDAGGLMMRTTTRPPDALIPDPEPPDAHLGAQNAAQPPGAMPERLAARESQIEIEGPHGERCILETQAWNRQFFPRSRVSVDPLESAWETRRTSRRASQDALAQQRHSTQAR